MFKFLQWLQVFLKFRQLSTSEHDPREAHRLRREREALCIARNRFIAAHRRFIL